VEPLPPEAAGAGAPPRPALPPPPRLRAHHRGLLGLRGRGDAQDPGPRLLQPPAALPQHTARGLYYDCRDVAFSPHGERWRQLCRIAALHLLSAKRVDSFRALREEEVASFLGRIRATGAHNDHEDGGPGGRKRRAGVNLSELLIGLTYAVISKAAFGNRLGGMEPGALRAMIKETSDLLETIAVSDVFPRLRWADWATGLDARIKRTAAKLDAVPERAFQEHEKGGGGEADDLLDDLLSAVKEGGARLNLDRTDVKGLILVSHARTLY